MKSINSEKSVVLTILRISDDWSCARQAVRLGHVTFKHLMAESVETPISKRRNRSSNSSTNDSPDTKKHRSSQNFSEEHHAEEDGEPPLATPNIMPSKDIQKTFQEILEKLGKLDIIESSVYKLQATLLDLETRTKTLEGFQHEASEDINGQLTREP